MPHMTARQAAVQALLKVDGEGGYSNLVLNEQLKKVQLSPEDTAFASRLFYGTLERKLTLDHIIGAYSKKPVHKLTPAVAEILRMSLYQLAFLDSVPDSAAVNEGVKLTRTMKAASASGFVNAVLRAFLRDGKELPPIKGGQLRQREVRYSCPQWIIRSLQQSYGEQAAIDFLEYSLERPPLYARVNTARGSVEACVKRLQEEGVRVQIDPDLPGCIALEQTASIERLSAVIRKLYAYPLPQNGSRTTFNVGQITGGTSVNTIAQQAEMLYEFRSDDRDSLLDARRYFESVIGAFRAEGLDVETELLGERPCGRRDNADPRQAALLQRCAEAVRRHAGIEPGVCAMSTDCNIPFSLGIPAAAVGLCRGGGAHTREEWIETESLKAGFRIAAELISAHFTGK